MEKAKLNLVLTISLHKKMKKSLMENFIFLCNVCSTVAAIRKNYWHLNTIENIDMYILQQSDSKFLIALLFGDTLLDINKNTFILDVNIDYIISAGRFDEPLFNSSLLAFGSITLKIKSWQNFYLGLFIFIFSTRSFLLHVCYSSFSFSFFFLLFRLFLIFPSIYIFNTWRTLILCYRVNVWY